MSSVLLHVGVPALTGAQGQGAGMTLTGEGADEQALLMGVLVG